jgi:hypothetical protein
MVAARFTVAPPRKLSAPHADPDFLTYRTGIIAIRCRNIARDFSSAAFTIRGACTIMQQRHLIF